MIGVVVRIAVQGEERGESRRDESRRDESPCDEVEERGESAVDSSDDDQNLDADVENPTPLMLALNDTRALADWGQVAIVEFVIVIGVVAGV